jgi:Kef-type K+ transport system membrane component KefB
MDLGARFWFGIVGLAVGVAVAAYLIFVLMGYAWYAWGFFGMLLFFSVVMIVFAYVHDRREASRRRRTTA